MVVLVLFLTLNVGSHQTIWRIIIIYAQMWGGGCGSSVAQGVDVYPLVDYNVLDKNNPNKLCISKKEGKLH